MFIPPKFYFEQHIINFPEVGPILQLPDMFQQPQNNIKIELRSVHHDLIFLHAMYEMPIKQLMQITHHVGGDLAFHPACRNDAGHLHQNYRRLTIPRNSQDTQQRIKNILDNINHSLSLFEENYLPDLLTQNIEADNMNRKAHSPYRNSTTPPKKANAKKEYSDIEDDLDDNFNDDTVDDSFYNKDPVVPVDPVVPGVQSTCFSGRSPPPGRHASMVLGIPSIPTMSSIQLYQTSESDVNILGLPVIVGNSKRVLDIGMGIFELHENHHATHFPC